MADITTIAAFARAGATDHAWRLFRAAGLEAVADDPDVLILRGRLLKEQARASATDARRRMLALDAGQAYADAARLRPATYPLVNAATLALLGGDPALAEGRARAVLELLEHSVEPDTPYWQMATQAEALLLIGDSAQAHAALEQGVALAPRAWEDHAVTLRQFREVIAVQGGDPAWLDGFRPPRSLHFTGVMQLGADVPELTRMIDGLIAAEQIGFGFGALAAGADILMAQRLLKAGAELHLVLPGGVEAFLARSVMPFGAVGAFEDLLEQAASVRIAGDPAGYDAAIQLADEMAMGLAVMQAEALQSEALQLVLRPEGGAIRKSSAATIWRTAGRRQHLLACADQRVIQTHDEARHVQNLAFLRISLATGEADLESAATIAPRLAILPDTHPALRDLTPDGLRLAYATPVEAVAAAIALRDSLSRTGAFRISGHYGPVARAVGEDGRVMAFGPAAALVERLLPVTPQTAVVLSEELTSAWRASAACTDCRSEFIGEIRLGDGLEPVRLHALKFAA